LPAPGTGWSRTGRPGRRSPRTSPRSRRTNRTPPPALRAPPGTPGTRRRRSSPPRSPRSSPRATPRRSRGGGAVSPPAPADPAAAAPRAPVPCRCGWRTRPPKRRLGPPPPMPRSSSPTPAGVGWSAPACLTCLGGGEVRLHLAADGIVAQIVAQHLPERLRSGGGVPAAAPFDQPFQVQGERVVGHQLPGLGQQLQGGVDLAVAGVGHPSEPGQGGRRLRRRRLVGGGDVEVVGERRLEVA